MVCVGDAAVRPLLSLLLDRGFWRRGQKKSIIFFSLCLQFPGKEQTYYQGRHVGEPFGEDWQQTPARQGERQGNEGSIIKTHQSHALPPGPPCPSSVLRYMFI